MPGRRWPCCWRAPGTGSLFLIPYVTSGCTVFNLVINGPSAEAEIEAAAEIRQHVLDASV